MNTQNPLQQQMTTLLMFTAVGQDGDIKKYCPEYQFNPVFCKNPSAAMELWEKIKDKYLPFIHDGYKFLGLSRDIPEWYPRTIICRRVAL